MNRPTEPVPGARLFFLDWVRILAFALLIVYHVGMYYVSWPWHVKSVGAGAALEPWMRLSAPWRMDLLFLVSGVASASMLMRRPADRAWLGDRAKRLLLPLLCGVLLIVPPQSWREVVQQHGYGGDYLEFMGLYLSGFGGFCTAPGRCLILPTWNHLWYLAYLALYTVLLWLLLRRWPGALAQAGSWLGARWHDGRTAWPWLLVLPLVWLALARLVLEPRFPDTRALVDDWNAHAHFLAMFMAGALLAHQPAAWSRFAAWRWPALCMALAAWAVLVFNSPPLGEPAGLPGPVRALLYVLQEWCAIVAALGFAARHLDRDSRWRRYLGDAVFPVYLLHQTLIILLAWAAAPLQLAPLAEGPLLALCTLALGLAGYEVLRRVPRLRPWFGLSA